MLKISADPGCCSDTKPVVCLDCVFYKVSNPVPHGMYWDFPCFTFTLTLCVTHVRELCFTLWSTMKIVWVSSSHLSIAEVQQCPFLSLTIHCPPVDSVSQKRGKLLGTFNMRISRSKMFDFLNFFHLC